MRWHHADHPRQRLTHLYSGIFTRRAPQRRHGPNVVHGALEIDVDSTRCFPRVSGEVYGRTRKLAMHPVGDERSEGGQQSAGDSNDLVERRERSPIVLAFNIVETMPALTHVPLRHIFIEEGHHGLCCVGRLVPFKQFVRFGLHRRQSRKYPAIEERTLGRLGILIGRSPAKVRVFGEDAGVDVLEREQKTSGSVTDSRFVETSRRPDLARCDEKEPDCICSMPGNDSPRIDDVAESLGHLLTFGIEHQIVDDDGAIGSCVFRSAHVRLVGELVVGQRVAEPCGDRQQRVEPAAGLIDAFGDEVGGVIPLELVPVLEREVPLGERHRS